MGPARRASHRVTPKSNWNSPQTHKDKASRGLLASAASVSIRLFLSGLRRRVPSRFVGNDQGSPPSTESTEEVACLESMLAMWRH